MKLKYMLASLAREKKLASSGLLSNRKEQFRIITAFARAKALSEGPVKPNKQNRCYGGRQFLKVKLKFIDRVHRGCSSKKTFI
jgi:hypothetical protein